MQVTRAIIQRYARICARHGSDLGERPLVLPNGNFFPDVFQGDAESAARITRRMCEHAGIEDIPIRTGVVSLDQQSIASASCSSGACGLPQTSSSGLARVVDEGDSWLLQIPESEMRHAVALTTNLARSLAFIFLVETKRDGEVLEPPVDVTADFTAVALGFGPLMLQGSYIYAKSCGGPRIGSVTKVTLPELAVAVALFVAMGDHHLAGALKELDVTQRALLSEADRWMRGNKKLVAQLRQSPRRVESGKFEFEEPGGLLSGLFRGRRGRARNNSAREDLLDPSLDLDEVESLMIDMPPSSTVTARSSRPEPARPEPRLEASDFETYSAEATAAQTSADPAKEELKSLVSEALRNARI